MGCALGSIATPKLCTMMGTMPLTASLRWSGNVMGWESGLSAVEGDGDEGTWEMLRQAKGDRA